MQYFFVYDVFRWYIGMMVLALSLCSDAGSTRLMSQSLPLEHVSPGNGLSQGMVHSLMQDSKGFIWIGTKDGLNRYDGYQFRIFRHNPFDTLSLSDNRIYSVVEDASNRFWVATAQGLNLFNPYDETFRKVHITGNSDGTPEETVMNSIIEDSHGDIWAKSGDAVLYRLQMPDHSFDLSQMTSMRVDLGNSSPTGYPEAFIIEPLIQYSDTLYLVNARRGLLVMTLDPGGTQPVLSADLTSLPTTTRRLLSDPHRKKMISGKDGKIWLFNRDAIHQIHPASSRVVIDDIKEQVPGWHPDIVWSAAENDQGTLMISTDLALLTIDPGQSITVHPPPPDEYFMQYYFGPVLFDAGGILWTGTRGAGLYKSNFRATRFSESRAPDDHVLAWEGPSIRALMQTDSGEIFVGRGYQILVIDPQSGEVHKANPAPSSALAFYEDHRGVVWTGGANLCEMYKDPVHGWSCRNYYPVPKHNFANGVKLLEASDSTLWILSIENICRFDRVSETFSCFDLPMARVTADYIPEYPTMIEDLSGNLWLGTPSGLLRFNPTTGEFNVFQNDPSSIESLGLNNVRSIALDPGDPMRYLWIGMAGGGLDKFDMTTGTFRHFDESHGLPDMTVYGILTDSDRNLWLSTNHGLAVMNTHAETFKTFSAKDGLLDNEFNAGAYWKTSDGVMLFGGIRGFNRFRPESVNHVNTHAPPIAFTGLRISNELVNIRHDDHPFETSITYSDQIVIPSRYKSFSIEFAAFDFYAPDQNQYQYKLEDFDSDWQSAREVRSATYTNLNPGRYTFFVRGSNSGGVWNTEGSSLNVVILPPWYRTWWAYLIYALAIGGLLYFIRRKELQEQHLKHQLAVEHIEAKKLKEIDSMKSRFFANISHELRTPLTLILGHLENADMDATDSKVKRGLHAAARSGKKLLQLINQLLDLSKIDAGRMQLHLRRLDMVPFLKHLLYAFESYAEQHEIRLRFESDEKSLMMSVDPDKMERVFTNLLSNAFKFTPGGGEIAMIIRKEASLTSDPTGEDLIVTVHDTGSGIPIQTQQYIFDRFYQSEDPRTMRAGGTGIGLALVRELVVLHGGTVSVESKEGEGAAFAVRLPMTQEVIQEDSEKIESSIPQLSVAHDMAAITSVADVIVPEYGGVAGGIEADGQPLLLLVEDNTEIRAFMRNQLEENGYRVIEAVHGEEGLRIARDTIPDLILTDVMMPVMDGIRFSQEIRADILTSHVPIVVLTARADEENKIAGLETGVDHYLTKPVSSRELLATVSNLIAQRQRLRERFINSGTMQPLEVSAIPIEQKFLENIMHIIESNLGDSTFGVEALAVKVHMSIKNLTRKLNALTGSPPGQFIRTARLQRAAILLEQQDGNVSEVAYDVGFTVPENFSRSFKKHFGVTPSDYARGVRSADTEQAG